MELHSVFLFAFDFCRVWHVDVCRFAVIHFKDFSRPRFCGLIVLGYGVDQGVTTAVVVPMVSNIASYSRRLPVILELASRLPVCLRGLVLLAAGAVLIPSVRAQDQPRGAAPPSVARQAGKLVLHRPVERELGAGQTDVFTLSVSAGLFLHVETEKKGVDVEVVLADPEGKPLITADSPNGAFGPVPASLIADRAGEYQIRVAARNRRRPAVPGCLAC